jgi:uncharacterized membrane protein
VIPQIWLFVTLGVAVAGGLAGAYVKGRSDGRALEVAERATLEEVARESREAAMQAAGEQIAKISRTHTTIRQQAEVITREHVVYRDCRNDAELVRLLDAARENRAPSQPASDRIVPGAGASPAPDVR